MTTKIRIKVGGIEVDYEGPEAFLDEKLYELTSKFSTLAKQVPSARDDNGSNRDTSSETPGSLASFLKEKNTKSQNDRFLATAIWLDLKGKKSLKTGDVTGALRDNQQKRLSNASDCLGQNIRKGYCEKQGREFFVTDEGKKSLG